ncbi:MAG TPA: hypothetical protein P5125_02125 [Kiritimatiellia bacterium]|nr:hypothetical protein [Kiritimatiellia bacterium]HPC49507.1 hypothetical protein [Kiritimatiellia bacterium]HRU19130.1 hypothetical protein [Kiritimatiellia bacterium]
MNTSNTTHTWHFFRSGGLDQALLRTGADLANLKTLDQKLWTALSCPTTGIRFDAATLKLLDTDADGRIRASEILHAIDWLEKRLTSLDPLLIGGDAVKLAAIHTGTAEGKALLSNAKRILKNLGKGDADAITLADVSDIAAIFAETRFNGDGVIPADAADAPALRQTIEEIIACFGAETDRSGKPGINQTKTDAFFTAVAEHLDWVARPAADPAIRMLGDQTATAFDALQAVRAKIDDYFTRCRMAEYDPRAAQALSRTDADLAELADKELTDCHTGLADFPLARIEAGRDLPLTAGVNPYWACALASFRDAVVTPLTDGAAETLSLSQWRELKDRFAPFAAWQAACAGTEVASLGADRLEALRNGNDQAEITALIAKDVALEAEIAQITEVEQLIRYHANLAALLNNYVNMGRLYDPEATALFQVGTLFMDARACNLCFEVDHVEAHAALAAASKCCLVYCSLTRPGAKTRTLCAAFTAGFAQTLWVGRNGIFYDVDGQDWDAVIIKTVDNAISIKEAFWDPWRKIGTMISTQINKLLSARQDAALAAASKNVDAAATAKPAEPPKKMEGAALASSVAALGIAVGLIGSAVGGLVSVLAGLPLWKTALGIMAVVLIVSGPSMILTWFKLRARDLAPILNACGWAINRRLRFSLKLGRLFTSEAVLPANSSRELMDPYADDSRARNVLLAVLALVAVVAALWFTGLLDSVLPRRLQRQPPAACALRAPQAESPVSAVSP